MIDGYDNSGNREKEGGIEIKRVCVCMYLLRKEENTVCKCVCV